MHEVKMPQMGQSVEEAEIVQWFKQEGDEVQQGDALFSIQTDKAEVECEATASGVLRKILLESGIEVPLVGPDGELQLPVVGLIGEAGEDLPDLSQYAFGANAAGVPAQDTEPAGEPPAPTVESAPAPQPEGGQDESPSAETTRASVSPRAMKKAAELGVDPYQAKGSGAGGRVMEEDVVAYAESAPQVRATPVAQRVAANEGVDLASVEGSGARGKVMKADVLATASGKQPTGAGETIPLTPMRRIIAERMVQSVTSAPHFYMTVEVDMTNAKALRESSARIRPSFNEIVMYATAQAIRDFPAVNARWLGDAIEQVADINLGFAMALPDGLIVPVVKQVQNMSLEGLHNETRALINKTKAGKLTPADYSGNTFTVSNLGAFGVDHFTAIINQPDSAILAVGQIKDQVVVVDGGIHIRPIMKLTLSSDHRVIDGAVAAQFMGKLKELLEAAQF